MWIDEFFYYFTTVAIESLQLESSLSNSSSARRLAAKRIIATNLGKRELLK
jgi:hypothetical protein